MAVKKITPVVVKKPRTQRKTLKLSLRVAVWLNDNGICHYCSINLPKPGNRAKTITTIDHIVPHSKGGADTADNLVICCKMCNRRKKDVEYKVYLLREQERLKSALKTINLRLQRYNNATKRR